jgi:hypothetical protein
VDVASDQVEVVFDTSLDELQRLAIAADRQAHMPLRAVYSAKVLFGAAISSETTPASTQKICVVGVRVNVRIKVADRKIHVARELRDSKCLLDAAVGHARAHARYQEQSLSVAREPITTSLREVLQRSIPPAQTPADAERALNRVISARIDAELAKIDADRTQAARALDSAEALKQLNDSCSGGTDKSKGERM